MCHKRGDLLRGGRQAREIKAQSPNESAPIGLWCGLQASGFKLCQHKSIYGIAHPRRVLDRWRVWEAHRLERPETTLALGECKRPEERERQESKKASVHGVAYCTQ